MHATFYYPEKNVEWPQINKVVWCHRVLNEDLVSTSVNEFRYGSYSELILRCINNFE